MFFAPIGEAADELLAQCTVLNVKTNNKRPSEKRGWRAPAESESFYFLFGFFRFLKAGCGSVHGHGLMFVLFFPVRKKKIVHGTIREWHLSGSKAVCVCVSVTFIFSIKIYLISVSPSSVLFCPPKNMNK